MNQIVGSEVPSARLYSDEMQVEMDRIGGLLTTAIDFGRPPDADVRKAAADMNNVWNIDLPVVKSVRHLHITADPSLDAAGCDAVVYQPSQPNDGVIFFVHGGGWAFLEPATHDRFMRVLCNEAKTTVVGVHYRLAPEHPFPAALNDVVSAFRKVLSARDELRLPTGPVVIAGDSAGGNLALATMLHEAAEKRELPAGALLFYGVFGADFATASYEAFADGHILTQLIMRQYWDWYDPSQIARSDPLAAPLSASDDQLRSLPPLFLVAAEIDPLASDTIMLKERLDRLGRTDQLVIEPGVIHGFLQMTATLEAARRSTRMAAVSARAFMAGAPNAKHRVK